MTSLPATEETVRIKLPRKHEAQVRIVAEARRLNVVCAGRQVGKTTLGIDRVVRGVAHGQVVGFFSPTYKFLADSWRLIRNSLRPITVDKSEQEHRVEVLGGGVVDCWSLDDEDSGRGRHYARVVVDEAAKVRNLEYVWQSSLRPTLARHQGDAWFLSTPRGLNFFHTLFTFGQDPLQTEWMSWQLPTSANPFIAPAELETLRTSLPERVYAQEVLAEFVNFAGGVFANVDERSILEPLPPSPVGEYIMGIDWGRTTDYTVLSVIDARNGQQVQLQRYNRIGWDLQLAYAETLARQYHVRSVVAESNGVGDPLVERLHRTGLPVQSFVTTNASKAMIVESLALALQQGEITLLDDAVQRAELMAFEAEILPGGLTRYQAPPGTHDDTVIALALAWQGAAKGQGVVGSEAAFAAFRNASLVR